MATLWEQLDQFMRDLNARHPDGAAVDGRQLPGWHPAVLAVPEGASAGGRDSRGMSLDDWERSLQVSSPSGWPPVW